MLGKKKKQKRVSLRNLPSKRSINLATVGIKKAKPSHVILGLILIVLVAGVIGKFAVYDRLMKVYRAQSEVAALQSQIDDGYKAIAEFGDLADEYAHYTYSNMTEEELNRADRVAILELIKNDVMKDLTVSSWTVTDNQIDMTVTGKSLQQINEIASYMQNHESMVNYTTVMTASTDNRRESKNGGVTAKIVVVLNGATEEAAQK